MSETNLLTVAEVAKKWGVTQRRVQMLCAKGEIKGAIRFGRAWMIPRHAVLPSSAKGETPHMPMPKKSPFLDMTNIYNVAGNADECAKLLVNNPEAYALFCAQIAYRRGDIDKVYDQARYFLNAHSGFFAILGGGMLLAQCAIWRGDLHLFNEAKRHVCEAPCKTEHEREMISLALAIIDSSIYNNNDFPDWFQIGNFEKIPADAHPATHVYYVKYLYMVAYAVASKQFKLDGVEGLSLMRMIPNTIEPLITQATVQKTVLCEIYLRFSCAVAYYISGERARALVHLDKALSLAVADHLYGVITEYVRHFDGLLEERLKLINPEALSIISNLYRTYSVGWSKLSGAVRNRYVAFDLTVREREIAKLVAFGFTNKEISALLYLSESTVKQTIMRVVQKTGVNDKSEFAYVL